MKKLKIQAFSVNSNGNECKVYERNVPYFDIGALYRRLSTETRFLDAVLRSRYKTPITWSLGRI